MKSSISNIKTYLSEALLNEPVLKADLSVFQSILVTLRQAIVDGSSEDYHKIQLIKFFSEVLPKGYFTGSAEKIDLAIHLGKDAKSPIGSIVELKSPTNKGEFIAEGNLNCKAVQELVYYYIKQRELGQKEICTLIATNIKEWYIFNAHDFEELFYENTTIIRQYRAFEKRNLPGHGTDYFYTEIAGPAIADAVKLHGFSGLRFSLDEFSGSDDVVDVVGMKVLSHHFLLKIPSSLDSNNLDKNFYNELLHIWGLEESKEGGCKTIVRKPTKRNNGALIENVIEQIGSSDHLIHMDYDLRARFGADKDEQIFNIAMELVTTWINRILFIKLLEGQMVAYAGNDSSAKAIRFINTDNIKSFSDLNDLFFKVLALPHESRPASVNAKFSSVPYLNSALFERTELERATFSVDGLAEGKCLPLFKNTILNIPRPKGKEISCIEYLLGFLNSYDYSNDTKCVIKDDKKPIIAASVLGLIFEKTMGIRTVHSSLLVT